MGAKGHRYKLSTHNIACPACLQNPNVREGGAVVATCSTCRGLGQLPATPATNPRPGPGVHQMQMVHALAHYLAARRSFAAYAQEVAASGRPDDGATCRLAKRCPAGDLTGFDPARINPMDAESCFCPAIRRFVFAH